MNFEKQQKFANFRNFKQILMNYMLTIFARYHISSKSYIDYYVKCQLVKPIYLFIIALFYIITFSNNTGEWWLSLVAHKYYIYCRLGTVG